MQESTPEATPPRRLDPDAIGLGTAQLDQFLRAHLIGQDEAIQEVLKGWVNWTSGLHTLRRPISNLLFTGPSGVGKTLIVELLADALLHNRGAITKIDCAEYQHTHEIAKLIGSPPGYLGHRETIPLLSQQHLNQYCPEQGPHVSFVLFDEIEKASEALWHLLLGILDKATLTLGDNQKVSFSNSMIFMTSNLGGRAIESLLKPRLGFAPAQPNGVGHAGHEAVRKNFTPEFRNRLDAVVVFQTLDAEQIRHVLEIELQTLNRGIFDRLAREATPVTLSDSAKSRLCAEGYEPQFGARHLQRAMQRHIVQPLARLIDSGQVTGRTIRVDFDGTGFQYFA
jgi:ATP-dependent Clp protease ATP-binding subunit ClpA